MKCQKSLSIHYGCKVNAYETNAMIQIFLENGYELVKFNEIADVYVVNTCTVTNISDKKSRQMLRKVKQQNSNSIIIATGCYAQLAKEQLEQIEEIDIILGNNEKKDIVKYVNEYSSCVYKNSNNNTNNSIDNFDITNNNESTSNNKRNNSRNVKISKVSKIEECKEFLEFGQVLHLETTRAVIKIQDGCNNFCSYCAIPYARGRIRSRKRENILAEIENIVKLGIKEIVLTGIHIASYGKEEEDNYYLIDLIEDINKINGLKRIRLGSLEPRIITEDFCNRLSKIDKICEHFHLSLQSGCDATLKRMNRKYTTEEFKKCTDLLRKNFKDVNLTTDLIVGFPRRNRSGI